MFQVHRGSKAPPNVYNLFTTSLELVSNLFADAFLQLIRIRFCGQMPPAFGVSLSQSTGAVQVLRLEELEGSN